MRHSSSTSSIFLYVNNYLGLSRDCSLRQDTCLPVNPSRHHSLMPVSNLATQPISVRQQLHWPPALRQQQALLQELLWHALQPDGWLALACTANSHINRSIPTHSLHHPSFSQDNRHGRNKSIQPILLVEKRELKSNWNKLKLNEDVS